MGSVIHIAGLDVVLVEVFAGPCSVDRQRRLPAYGFGPARFGHGAAGNGNVHLVVDARFQGAFHVDKVVVGFADIRFSRSISDYFFFFVLTGKQVGDLYHVFFKGFAAIVRRQVDIPHGSSAAVRAHLHLLVVLQVQACLRGCIKRQKSIVMCFRQAFHIQLRISSVYIGACIQVDIVGAV